MHTRPLLGIALCVALCSCGKGDGSEGGSTETGTDSGVSEGCGSVRLTEYSASSSGWCEFDRTSSVLPSFVRDGLTFAISEPYNGSSYGGAPGESCGECWEVSTVHATRIVMVHDLCPIDGNPLCAGDHFHFDLAGEAADALQGGALDAAATRRVPCPVSGNVFAQINDRNEWGYLRLQFINQRIPIRAAEYRNGSGQWVAVQRSGGAWHILDDGETFSSGGPGSVFRLTSAQGEVVEGANTLTYAIQSGALFDLGLQFTDQLPTDDAPCEFVPPADVYIDGFGGIPEVRWAINLWGDAQARETQDDCYSGSCLEISPLPQWSGFHLYYRQAFPSSTFATLSLWLRASPGPAQLNIAPSNDGQRCSETIVDAGPQWTRVTLDIAAVCHGMTDLNGITMDNPGGNINLLLDDVRFEK